MRSKYVGLGLLMMAVIVAGGQAMAASSSGMPAWVGRGNVAQNDGGKRVFYGVASASGIKNPQLLRSTADNRARNEIAKIFEVFSASLMKDFSASSGAQNVQQAVKTFTSMSLEGVEIVDHYIVADGTMYSLAALDLEKVLAGVKKAKELGAVKSYVEKVSVDDIFDAHSKKPAAPPKPVVAAGDSAPKPATAPKEATSASTKKGGKPAWVDGEDANYPYRKFLCGVGYGPQRPIAENGSYAALSKIFVSSVTSVSNDMMGAYSKTGAPTLEVQKVETLTQVVTSKVISGVQVYELWEDKATTYALGCLERERAAQGLREQISEADGKVGKLLEQAASADKASKVGKLGKALSTLVEREAFNGELRIVDANGVGIAGQYSHADIAAALEEAVSALRIGVRVEGSHTGDVSAAIKAGLTGRGWEISEVGGGDDDDEDDDDAEPLDIEILAKVRMENAGKGELAGGEVFFVRGVIQMQVRNVAKGKVIATLDESRKEGHRSLQEAERRSVRELAKKLAGTAAEKIDSAMKGKKS